MSMVACTVRIQKMMRMVLICKITVCRIKNSLLHDDAINGTCQFVRMRIKSGRPWQHKHNTSGHIAARESAELDPEVPISKISPGTISGKAWYTIKRSEWVTREEILPVSCLPRLSWTLLSLSLHTHTSLASSVKCKNGEV